MTEVRVQCPVPDCEDVKVAESEDKAIKKLCGHISGKKDDAHSGFSRDQMRTAITNDEPLTSDTRTDTPETDASPSQTDASSDEGLGMPGSPERNVSDDTDVPDCPSCGEPLAPASELKKMGRFRCSSCGHGPLEWTE